ncbi:MAG: GHKL domain-containing protein [Phycisphaerales bacterium]|nr:GHKL domain-containing protein [Phycisphaerales bacterium]
MNGTSRAIASDSACPQCAPTTYHSEPGYFLTHVLDTSDFPPRWRCGTWTGFLGWMHIISDALIWGAYIAIPCLLVVFLRRRPDVPFPAILWLFVAFIVACGLTHLMEAIIFWWPAYRVSGLLKMSTAVISWVTVFSLVKIVPRVLAFRSPAQVEQLLSERTSDLKKREAELADLNVQLEQRVSERTRQLKEEKEEVERQKEVALRMMHDLEQSKQRAEKARSDLAATQERLLVASRQAGMAEIATGVLHNVGNVLNSVNVSATLVSEKARNSKVSSLARTVDLIREHGHDLGRFMTDDEKGRKLPGYLGRLAEHLADEQNAMIEELQSLTRNIEHIKDIVTTQQSHAGAAGVIQSTQLKDVLEDALTMSATSFERHGITLVRDYVDLPDVALDKQKLLQILINLIRNAKHALIDNPGAEKRILLRISQPVASFVRIEVSDTGVGIAPENLERIFSHGFTTKRDGHGFGLHSAALAAKEMRGSLSVTSDGPGLGATFTIGIPFDTAEARQ